jgi:hypothetical protein
MFKALRSADRQSGAYGPLSDITRAALFRNIRGNPFGRNECTKWVGSEDGSFEYNGIQVRACVLLFHNFWAKLPADYTEKDPLAEVVLHSCDDATCMNVHHMYMGVKGEGKKKAKGKENDDPDDDPK